MKRERELASLWSLPPGALEALTRLVKLLSADPHAPIAATDQRRAVEVHVADSLLGLGLDPVRSARRIVDIGSGAGLPGLVIAAALPGAAVDLVEATGRKCDWIAATATAMGLSNARAINARVEDWAAQDGRDAYDAALARAVDSLPVLVEYASPLLKPDGVLVAWKRNLGEPERQRGVDAAALLGMEPAPPRPGDRPGGDTELIVYRKSAPTPEGYPRRPGRARKRPVA